MYYVTYYDSYPRPHERSLVVSDWNDVLNMLNKHYSIRVQLCSEFCNKDNCPYFSYE